MDANIQDLIVRFEKDMMFDCHGNLLRVSRSSAARRLLSLGKKALPQITAHLSQEPPNQQLEIHICWGMLLDGIAVKLCIWEKPTTFDDIEGWIAMAKRESENQ